MDSEVLPPATDAASTSNPSLPPEQPGRDVPQPGPAPDPSAGPSTGPLPHPLPHPLRDPLGVRLFLGPQGLRAGWSVALFGIFYYLVLVLGTMVAFFSDRSLLDFHFTPGNTAIAEAIPLFAILVAGYILSRFERRNFTDYYLRSARPVSEFLWGAAAGFIGLSALVAMLAAGGWIHLDHAPAFGLSLLRSCILWTVAFCFTGFFEEGSFRCYLQFTLTRGINFWWALAAQAAICGIMLAFSHGLGAYGVYAFAALGLAPCLIVHLRRTSHSGFWQAAWVTSTGFAAYHTGNSGETAFGIFAVAAIGLVFCVGIRVTGSAWWAIGCHAAWDWAETFFYGTANSGNVPHGSFFATSPAGKILWSGGTCGPEGSLLILPAMLFLLVLLFVYARLRETGSLPAASGHPLSS